MRPTAHSSTAAAPALASEPPPAQPHCSSPHPRVIVSAPAGDAPAANTRGAAANRQQSIAVAAGGGAPAAADAGQEGKDGEESPVPPEGSASSSSRDADRSALADALQEMRALKAENARLKQALPARPSAVALPRRAGRGSSSAPARRASRSRQL